MDEISVLEQLEKRIEWLDIERRNDKNNLASHSECAADKGFAL